MKIMNEHDIAASYAHGMHGFSSPHMVHIAVAPDERPADEKFFDELFALNDEGEMVNYLNKFAKGNVSPELANFIQRSLMNEIPDEPMDDKMSIDDFGSLCREPGESQFEYMERLKSESVSRYKADLEKDKSMKAAEKAKKQKEYESMMNEIYGNTQ